MPKSAVRLDTRDANLTACLRELVLFRSNRPGDRRPMAEHPQAMADLRRLLATREPLYAQSAHTIDTARLGVAGTVRAIERLAVRTAPFAG